MEKQQHLHNKGTVWKHGLNISNFRDGGNMNKKVSELSGSELDYWVARASGFTDEEIQWREIENYKDIWMEDYDCGFHPSTNWEHIGPIIEKHKICVYPNFTQDAWIASLVGMRPYSGTTPQLAACRAFVASVYGDSVCLSDTENT